MSTPPFLELESTSLQTTYRDTAINVAWRLSLLHSCITRAVSFRLSAHYSHPPSARARARAPSDSCAAMSPILHRHLPAAQSPPHDLSHHSTTPRQRSTVPHRKTLSSSLAKCTEHLRCDGKRLAREVGSSIEKEEKGGQMSRFVHVP